MKLLTKTVMIFSTLFMITGCTDTKEQVKNENMVMVGGKSFTVEETYLQLGKAFGKNKTSIFLFPTKLSQKDLDYLGMNGSPGFLSTKAPKGWEKLPSVDLTLYGGELKEGKFTPENDGSNTLYFAINHFFDGENSWGDTTIPHEEMFKSLNVVKEGNKRYLIVKSDFTETDDSDPKGNKRVKLDLKLEIPNK